jgi:hypothetical protein
MSVGLPATLGANKKQTEAKQQSITSNQFVPLLLLGKRKALRDNVALRGRQTLKINVTRQKKH